VSPQRNRERFQGDLLPGYVPDLIADDYRVWLGEADQRFTGFNLAFPVPLV
jgi:hypothetical protein